MKRKETDSIGDKDGAFVSTSQENNNARKVLPRDIQINIKTIMTCLLRRLPLLIVLHTFYFNIDLYLPWE
jgi:hypothetical protein